jgi:hypothetical protein
MGEAAACGSRRPRSSSAPAEVFRFVATDHFQTTQVGPGRYLHHQDLPGAGPLVVVVRLSAAILHSAMPVSASRLPNRHGMSFV